MSPAGSTPAGASRHRTKLFLTILAAGFLARLLFVFAVQPYEDRERFEMERAALALAESGRLADPYHIPTGPTAHVAPVYPALLAAVFRLFGAGLEGEIVKVLLSTLLSVLPYALFPYLAVSLGLSDRLGFWCGLAGSLIPLKPTTELLGDWEAPLAATLLVLCTAAVARLWRQQELTGGNALRLGILWGFALLSAPGLLSVYLLMLAAGYVIVFSQSRRAYLSHAAIQILCVAAMLLPWAVRNYLQLGWPVFTRSNFGLELRLSNNDLAQPRERDNMASGAYARYHPLISRAEAEQVRRLGEMEYNRRARTEALAWIQSRPGRFLKLTALRAIYFWFPNADPGRALVFACLSVFSFAGTVLLYRRDRATGIALAVCLLAQPLPHYVVHVGLRYKYPTDWIGILGAGLILSAAWSLVRVHGSAPLPYSPARAET